MNTTHEVVISGIAGNFPESWNVNELKENLMRKINLVTNDERKWCKNDMDVPLPTGKVPEADAFDDMFFGIPLKHSVVLDQNVKQCLEASFGAICDAGINPGDLAGTDTAVISCSCVSESEYVKSLQFHSKSGALITGMSRTMQANRISFHLNTAGPSYAIDSSWTGCFDGIKYAYDRISKGTMKAAIVTSCNLLYTPEMSYHYKRIGRLNSDGCTKSFSNDADGYSRSEACVAFFIQRKEDALRCYGSVLGVSTSNQEAKHSYFLDISPKQFLPPLKNVYDEKNIDPRAVAYVEAAGCASKLIDAEELNTIAELMLPGREHPLLIGCVKSNLGHCEASADSVALIKALIAADSGVISPNLHYSSPNSMVPALVSGKLKVVTEPTPLQGNIIGVNSISVIGSIKHLIIKQHDKKKTIEPEVGKLPPDGLPRLFIMTGREKEATEATLEMVQNMPIDSEFIALSHRVFKKGIKNHMFRGYTIINDVQTHVQEVNESFTGGKTGQIWFVFTGMGSQWLGMGTQLLKIPTFRKAIDKCNNVLEPLGENIYEILTTEDPTIFDDIIKSFLAIAAIQIGLVDILYELGIYPDGIIGHSVGELGCAYADGCLTAEQMIRCAYARGIASHTNVIPGLMAAVGMGYNTIKNILPEEIDVACHNSKHNCTLSGPAEAMKKFVDTLLKQNIFARLVNTANIAYHSRYIKPAGPTLLKELKKVILQPKLRSKKWICTSVPEAQWDTDLAKYCSAEYQTNNLLSSVLFEEASKHIPKDATVIEIAPHGLLQPILKQILPQANHIPLTKRGEENGLIYFLKALGKMYLNGHSFDIEKLYPPIAYPVSRGTASISPLLNWNHSHICRPAFYLLNDFKKKQDPLASRTLFKDLEVFDDLKSYQLKGVPTIPLGAYLACGIHELRGRKNNDFHLVQFKNVKMLKHVDFIDKCDLTSLFQIGSGHWQINLNDVPVFNAEIEQLNHFTFSEEHRANDQNEPGSQFYEQINHFGLNLGPSFKLIQKFDVSDEGVSATVLWNGNLMNFLEAVLQVPVAGCKDATSLMSVSRVSCIKIDLHKFPTEERKPLNVYFNKITKVLSCDGLQIISPIISPANKKSRKEFIFQEPHFVPYDASIVNNINSFLELVKEIIYSNLTTGSISSKDLTLLIVGQEINIYEELYKTFKNVLGLNVFVKIIPEDTFLTEQEKNQYKSKNVLIASASPSTTNSIDLINYCRQGYMLIRDQPLPQGFEVILGKKVGNHQYYFCKKEGNDIENCTFICLSSNNWMSQLQNHLNTYTEKSVYLVGHVTRLSKMYFIIKKTSLFNNSHNLRYIFHDMKDEEFQPIYYTNQIVKGLRINIFNGKQWGLITTKSLKMLSLPNHQHVQSSAYKFSEILMEDMEVKAIALNSSDFGAVNDEGRVIEYSGANKQENICGIGFFGEETQKIKSDSILKWKKPSNWSHDEIVSIFLPYTAAYYILKLVAKGREFECAKCKTILVHRGHLPFSQAVINVAESEGLEIFTTYKNNNEKLLIERLFPKIPSENILSCQTISFSDILCKKTNGEGINIVVSCLSDKEMIFANSQVVSQKGIIYQTAFENNLDELYLGLGIFMKEVSIIGLTPLFILMLPNNEKEILQDMINRSLKIGKIKPLTMKTVSNNVDNFTAYELFTDPDFMDSRVVMTKNGKCVKKSPLSLCEEGAHHMIIVPPEAQSYLWIKILEWLIRRRASTIHIIIDWSKQPDFISEKFNNLKIKNPAAHITSEAAQLLDTPGKVKQLIHGIKQRGKLSSIFITSEEESVNLKSICEAAGDARIVYFTNKVEEIFEESAENGLIVVDHGNLLDADILTSYTDSLVQLTSKFIILCDITQLNSSIVVDDPWKAYNQHLPLTLEEVLYFSNDPKKFDWKEVRTNTLRLQENKGLTPILVIPPIKKGQHDQLIKSLFNPAFEAVIPTRCNSVPELVQGLFKKALNFKNNELTLLCSDWSFFLGVQLGKVLESAGKKVNIVFLEPLLDWDASKLYQAIHQKITKEFECNSISERKRHMTQTGLAVVQKRLELIQNGLAATEKENKLQGVVVIVKNKFSSNKLLPELRMHCENPVHVHCSEEMSYLEMVNSKETANIVNSTAVVNCTDAANSLPKSFVKNRYSKNPRHFLLQKLVNIPAPANK